MLRERDDDASTMMLEQLVAPAVVHQATGVLMERHGTSIDEAFRALRAVADREGRDIEEVSLAVVTPADRALPPHAPTPGMPSVILTPRELEILRELPTLSTVKGIALALFVSNNTVKTHVRTVYQKLGVTSRRDAVAEARRLGLI